MADVHICHQQDTLIRWGFTIDINTLYLENCINTLYLNINLVIKMIQLVNNN